MPPRVLLLVALLLLSGPSCGREAEMPEGPDPRYWRYERILEKFAEWERDHPDVFRTEEIGRTRRGEAIRAARIRGRTEGAAAAPVLLFHAAQHANEANGTNAIMVLMERLLEERSRDGRIAAMVEGLDLLFVPVVNVDGYRAVFRGGPGWRERRRNGREPDGVDLNRNWDHKWETDPSTDPGSRNYKGPRPFSEPETVALRDLVRREMPLFVVDFHSPGKVTPGNVIFWPWLFREEGRLGPDAPIYREIARAFAARTETEEDGAFYDGDGPAFDTLPKEQCYVYRETGICILLMEISARFWWEGPIVTTIAERVADGSLALLDRALGGPGLEVRVTAAATGLSLDAEVRVEEHHDPAIGPRRTRAGTGIHRRLLRPGPATVTVLAAGFPAVTRRVAITGSGWTRLDVPLP